jgi:superoxide dismutase, Cu-Zn family
MNRLPRLSAVGLVAAGLLAVGYARTSAEPAARPLADEKTPAERPDQQNATPTTAIARIHGAGPNKDKIKGTVTFVQRQENVRVLIDVDGLTPGKHGIHIHEKTDLSDPELKGAGGHWNPEGHHHGEPNKGMHHAGDLGNITADDKGKAKVELSISGITVNGEKNGVVGHSIVIHEKEDDLKSDPAGNSGARIAGGVIELSKKDSK